MSNRTDEKSEIWNSVIPALRNGGGTVEEIAEKSETTVHAVRRTLQQMKKLGWVEWPVDDGGFEPGETANKLLREP